MLECELVRGSCAAVDRFVEPEKIKKENEVYNKFQIEYFFQIKWIFCLESELCTTVYNNYT